MEEGYIVDEAQNGERSLTRRNQFSQKENEQQERIFTRGDILDLIRNHNFRGDHRTVDTHIKNLRDKLTASGISDNDVIKTVWGVGYK
ncbi:winged helix-turn-helix domain-containing protein [Aneurinibacillus terranovensis]|uniref:winged helix-turn-helix domain-containing protein n=1 Tax=Aneurinibacillus terranovensis TaxID=278991 RepID=UPI0004149108|nr:helix-turn-helix domain-containing protein [Aneurinibacillus terranovensis]